MRPHFHDLFQAQKSCRELDEKKEYLEPPEPWFWPPPPKKEKEEDDEEEEKNEAQKLKDLLQNQEDERNQEEEYLFTAAEKLGMVVRYLRTTHLYCLYCGIQWINDLEMDVECPGPDRGDHD